MCFQVSERDSTKYIGYSILCCSIYGDILTFPVNQIIFEYHVWDFEIYSSIKLLRIMMMFKTLFFQSLFSLIFELFLAYTNLSNNPNINLWLVKFNILMWKYVYIYIILIYLFYITSYLFQWWQIWVEYFLVIDPFWS